MRAVDAVAIDKARYRELAYVFVDVSTEKIVKNTQAQRAAYGIDTFDTELRDRRRHDRQPAREDRHPLGLERVQLQPPHILRQDHSLAQSRQARRRDTSLGK